MSRTCFVLFLAELNRLGVRCAAAITKIPGPTVFGLKCIWVSAEIGEDKLFYCSSHHVAGHSFEVVK